MIQFRGVLSALCTMLVPFIMNGQNTVRPDSIQEPEPVDSVGHRGPSKTAEEDTGTGFFKGVIPCSPQAAALARYAEFPVSHTTGIPEISVPLYEIDLGGYRLPISISYHASGARPDEMPTSVGLGWSLNAGGAITRTILGKPDMYNYEAGSDNYDYFDFDNIRDMIYEIKTTGGGPELEYLNGIITDAVSPDTESDRYTFNIPGETGVFRYSYKDGKFMTLNNSNWVIEASGYSDSASGISFRMLDNIGIEYVFEQEEGTGIPDIVAERPFTTAWYVTRIITPYGNIDFTYEKAMPVVVQSIDIHADGALRPEYDIEGFVVLRYKTDTYEQANRYHYGQSILKKIEWNGNRIEFSHVDEHPGETMQRLTGMKVYNSDGELRKSIGFGNTDNWPTEDSLTGRRLLRSVSDSEAGIWRFEYDKSYQLPALPLKDARATCCDLWGYWNTSVPDSYRTVFSKAQWEWVAAGNDHGSEDRGHDNLVGNKTFRNRKPSLPHTMAGVLKKIVFPTGGNICYEYELNRIQIDKNTSRKYGGLRVKSTTLYQDEDAAGQVTRFEYAGEQTTVGEPEYLMRYISYEKVDEDRYDTTNEPEEVRNIVDFPINPVNAAGTPLVYRGITEIRPDGSKVSYLYDTEDLCRLFGVGDISTHPLLYEQSRRDFGIGRPLLIWKSVTDAKDSCIYQESYTYEKQEVQSFPVGIRTICPFIEYNFPGSWHESPFINPAHAAYFEKLQYKHSLAHKWAYLLKSKTVSYPQTKFSTTTSYTYDDGFRTFEPRSVTVTGSDGVSHRTEYSYPFDFPDDPMCIDMVTNYQTDLPIETSTYSGTDVIAKERTEYVQVNSIYCPVASSSWSMPTSSIAADRTVPETLPERERVSAYNGKGRPLSITSNLTDVTSFKWDSTGTLLLAATAPGGLTTSYTHRPLFGLSSETLPNGFTKTYEYNGTGMLVKESDNGGPVSEYSYSVLNHFNPSLGSDGNSVTTMLWLDGAGSKKTVSRQYYNGTGAPTTLARGGLNTSGKYVYTSVKYDSLGRKSHETLPGAGGSSPADKTYAEVTALSQQTNGDDYVSSEITYDAAGRPLSVTTPGKAWHEASKSRETEYVANKASSVRLYKAPMNSISLVEDGYYGEKTLQGERTVDEDGKEMTVYTDRLGRKVLERRGPESRKGSNDTYFVYNDLGQLRYVLTPGYEQSGYKDKFAYEYRYDESGNVVKKFIPGAGYTQYWYDRAGRLTFMQDENLRASGLHRFFVYDKAGRQVIQGVSALCSRGREVNAAAYTGGSSGFMSTGYTLSDGSRLQQVTLECVDYYDGYDFADACDPRLAKGGTASAAGLPTGETVYSSDGSRSVSASYYDEKGNIVELRELTAFGSLRVTSTAYNYSGLPLSTVMTEKDITVQTDNTYHDSTGLLLHTDVTVNGTRQRVSSLTYDDLGRVIADTRGDGAAVSGTSYTYDLHGRVTSISGPGFSQRLHYADGPGNRLYNGMISSMSWTMGDDATERGYRYAYNDFNWLTAAEYGEGPSLDSHKNRYTERCTEFMPNGGVRRLQRHGLKADGEYGKIDNLHIHYDGNRIKEVLEDAEPTTQTGGSDFPGKTGLRSSFEYNAWGALVRDDGRNISSIAYDNLGNPVGVKFSTSDGSGARYVYSAKGERLKAEHRVNVTVEVNPVSKAPQLSDGPSVGDPQPLNPNIVVTTRLEYHGPVVYRNGKVDRVQFSGGYATIDGGNVTFHYYTRDCQGSNRAVVNGTTGAVEQTVAYYPYGGVIADLGTGAGIQPCKFGGKELTLYNGLDEYDFGARQYYPAVPHFTRIDPLCEDYYWLSPYLYCANDPVNNIDPTGEFIETAWDIGNTLYDAGKAIYSHIKGDHKQARSHWVDAAFDLGAVIIPGVPAGMSKIGKSIQKISKVSKSSTAKKGLKHADRIAEGKQFGKYVPEKMRQEGYNIETEVRLVPLNGKGNVKGNRTDGDILMKNTNETFTLGEVKLTKETRLTTGQRRAKKHIEESNGKFEVKRDIPQFGISKNQVIKITNFEKITKYE